MKKIIFTAMLGLLVSTGALAQEFKDVVRTEDGIVVRNTFNNCVLTKWDSSNNECGVRAIVQMNVTERTIYFDFAKDSLTPAARLKLDALVRHLRSASNIASVKVVGYADEIGDTASNEALSGRRADAVESYLRNRVNLPFSASEVRGLGETGSRTNCDREQPREDLIQCLANDRRVEVELQYTR